MKKKIIILGDGLAAKCLKYHLTQLISSGSLSTDDVMCLSLKTKGPDNNKFGGVRYLHAPMKQEEYSNFVGEVENLPVSGGVIWRRETKRPLILPWSMLVNSPDIRLQLTRQYAEEQNRPWSKTIMDNLLARSSEKDVPSTISMTYNEALLKLDESNQVESHLHDDIQVDHTEHQVKCTNSSEEIIVNYESLLSTIPLWVLSRQIDVPFNCKPSAPRYEFRRTQQGLDDCMWYILGVPGIKRLSVIGSDEIMETTVKDPDLTFINNYSSGPEWSPVKELPPNISELSEIEKTVLYELLPNEFNIHCIGRFAEMNPRALFGDIFERSYKVTRKII